MKNHFLFIVLFFFLYNNTSAQVVWENHRSEVYPYLARMAQKGLIEFNDIIKPVSRQYIYELLHELEKKEIGLSIIEKKELHFYLKEYRPLEYPDSAKIQIAQKDANGRWRLLSLGSKDFQLHVDPLLSTGYVTGTTSKFRQVSNGFQIWGHSKRWGFQLYYRDITESGKGIDTFRKESPETGITRVGPQSSGTKQNFSDLRGHLSYGWKNGSISFGKDQYLWGYGENGRIVLSEKSPSYSYFRFDYHPFKWLHYAQIHGWLNSNIIDSNRTYGTGTVGLYDDIRIVYRPKFIANHSLTFNPLKGLSVALGESVIYSDKWDPVFMLPIMLFKVYDNNRSSNIINAGSNGQIFAQISSRGHIPKMHLYSTLFIDEIRISTLLNAEKRRAQLGFNFGFSKTDFLLPYLTIGAEYTRVNPFVYQNLIPTQFYTHENNPLGDWLGANSDRSLAFIKYTPLPNWQTMIRFQQIRKGGEGSLLDQYLAEPQPPFLSEFQKKRTDILAQIKYEWINNLYITASYQERWHQPNAGVKSNERILQLGISYGLR